MAEMGLKRLTLISIEIRMLSLKHHISTTLNIMQNKTVSEANNYIQDSMSSWNKDMPGKVIILNLRVPEGNLTRYPFIAHPDLIHVAQVSRLFVSKFLKYTVDEVFHQKLHNIYLMTTDADLIPLSGRPFYELAPEWNVVGSIQCKRDEDKFYTALSSIGASVGTWDELTTESEFELEYFNGTGLVKMIHEMVDKQIEKGVKKAAWFLDQYSEESACLRK